MTFANLAPVADAVATALALSESATEYCPGEQFRKQVDNLHLPENIENIRYRWYWQRLIDCIRLGSCWTPDDQALSTHQCRRIPRHFTWCKKLKLDVSSRHVNSFTHFKLIKQS